MTDLIAALDIGGTKTQLIIETTDGKRLVDVTEPSHDWEAEPAHVSAPWIAERVKRHTPAGGRIVSMAFGAQGIDRPETAHHIETELEKLGHAATAVNDASLLIAAAGFTEGIGVIAGTGAIAVGADASGRFMAAGGWGWVIGDDGGASALVREATKAALYANDSGLPDDGLLSALIRDFGVADAERLTRKVNDEPTMDNWAPHAPAVFAAADAGSVLARRVIDDGAKALAANVGQLRKRGAVGTDVVVAGSVIVNQKRLLDAFTVALGEIDGGLSVHVLEGAPVEGAVQIARRRLAKA
jgi:N-acetylglucosamine kinase-like BadF-type ATPase